MKEKLSELAKEFNQMLRHLTVPIMEAANAEGMSTIRQNHLHVVFHAYATFIISLYIFIQNLFKPLSVVHFCITVSSIIVKLALNQP